MSIFDKYASKIDAAELAKSQQEIEANSQNSGEREEVPNGSYEVKAEHLEAKVSKTGNPMVNIWFRILHGKFEKSVIFYNGTYHEDWMRHRVAKFLSDLLDDGDRTAEINCILKGNLREVNEFLSDVQHSINDRLEYLLDYGESKGYKTYAIAEVYDV